MRYCSLANNSSNHVDGTKKLRLWLTNLRQPEFGQKENMQRNGLIIIVFLISTCSYPYYMDLTV
jgi:hypothetical protein